MSDRLHEEQLRWAQLLKNASNPVEVELTEVAEQAPDGECALRVKTPNLTQPDINDFGNCTVCHKHRRLWSGVCGWCGADPEDFEE
jgi:hypothetical protein